VKSIFQGIPSNKISVSLAYESVHYPNLNDRFSLTVRYFPYIEAYSLPGLLAFEKELYAYVYRLYGINFREFANTGAEHGIAEVGKCSTCS
jgi:hypothetical protein